MTSRRKAVAKLAKKLENRRFRVSRFRFQELAVNVGEAKMAT